MTIGPPTYQDYLAEKGARRRKFTPVFRETSFTLVHIRVAWWYVYRAWWYQVRQGVPQSPMAIINDLLTPELRAQFPHLYNWIAWYGKGICEGIGMSRMRDIGAEASTRSPLKTKPGQRRTRW